MGEPIPPDPRPGDHWATSEISDDATDTEIREACRRLGCNCEPRIGLVHGKMYVAHKPWCRFRITVLRS
jgi:hypothetical protein